MFTKKDKGKIISISNFRCHKTLALVKINLMIKVLTSFNFNSNNLNNNNLVKNQILEIINFNLNKWVEIHSKIIISENMILVVILIILKILDLDNHLIIILIQTSQRIVFLLQLKHRQLLQTAKSLLRLLKPINAQMVQVRLL